MGTKPIARGFFNYLLLALIGVFFVFPLLWTLISSVKPENDIVAYPPRWVPVHFTLGGYAAVLHRYPYLTWMFNSIIVAVASTLFVLVLTSLAAYAFARIEFRGRKVLFAIVISMLLIPIQVYVVPLFLLTSALGLLNSLLSLILVSGAQVTGVYILTSFFKTIPRELDEAARIDGAKDFAIFRSIILPLSNAPLSSVAILTFITNWNSFLWPLISIRDNVVKTLPVGIAQFMGNAGQNASSEYGPGLAAAMMAIVPSVIVFLLLQRYFVQGIASSGIKG